MAEVRNGVFWRSLAAAIGAILISVLGYYVYLNDERWRENSERWRDLDARQRQEVVDVQTRLARIEETQRIIMIRLEDRR